MMRVVMLVDAGKRLKAMAFDGARVGEDLGCRAIVDARGVSGGHRAVGPERRGQAGELLERRLARMLVIADKHCLVLAAPDWIGGDLAGSRPLFCAAAARLAAPYIEHMVLMLQVTKCSSSATYP